MPIFYWYYAIRLPWYSNLLSYYTPTIRQTIMLLYSYWYNISGYYTPTDTASYYVTISLSIQQTTTLLKSHWYNNLLRHHTLIDTATPYDTKILPLQLLRHYELYCRNNSHATKALYHSHYYATMTHTSSSYITMLHTVSTTITQAL